MMRGLVAAAAVCLLTACMWRAAAAEDGLPAGEQAAVQSVIRQQMAAFAHDDAPGAFALAAPGIQRMFSGPEQFMAMVRHAYQPVYAPRSADFTAASDENGAVMQSVELIGPDGSAYTAVYTMEHEPDGSWRIAACVLLESRRVGA